jgi:hypothetical protein
LSARWPDLVLPALRRWILAEPVDADAYQALRNPAPSLRKAQNTLELRARHSAQRSAPPRATLARPRRSLAPARAMS